MEDSYLTHREEKNTRFFAIHKQEKLLSIEEGITNDSAQASTTETFGSQESAKNYYEEMIQEELMPGFCRVTRTSELSQKPTSTLSPPMQSDEESEVSLEVDTCSDSDDRSESETENDQDEEDEGEDDDSYYSIGPHRERLTHLNRGDEHCWLQLHGTSLWREMAYDDKSNPNNTSRMVKHYSFINNHDAWDTYSKTLNELLRSGFQYFPRKRPTPTSNKSQVTENTKNGEYEQESLETTVNEMEVEELKEEEHPKGKGTKRPFPSKVKEIEIDDENEENEDNDNVQEPQRKKAPAAVSTFSVQMKSL
jgi:predicted DNA-binding WGR domain protein